MALIRVGDQLTCNDNMVAASSLDEVSATISATKNCRAPGSDCIPAEIFEYGGEIVLRQLHGLFLNIWNSEDISQDFKDTTTVSIYKRKAEKSNSDNYCSISLLSIAGQILTRVLFDCPLCNIANHPLLESQCGFRPM